MPADPDPRKLLGRLKRGETGAPLPDGFSPRWEKVGRRRPERSGPVTADWPNFLQYLARDFGSVVALFYHEFGEAQQGAMLDTVGITDEYVRLYRIYSPQSPWLSILWREPTGKFIFGEGDNDRARLEAEFGYFDFHWMRPQNLARGIGAVLFKDRDIAPGWAVAIGLMRPDGKPGIGRYSAEERARFASLVSDMVRNIANHSFVEKRIIRDKVALLQYNTLEQPGEFVPKRSTDYEATNDFLDRLAITSKPRRELLTELIAAAQRGDEGVLDEVWRTMETHRAARESTQSTGPGAPLLTLPDAIPEEEWYRNRPKGQTLRQFLEEDGWPAPYVRARILARPQLNKLDPSAYTAIYSTKEGAQLPPDLIPTKPRLVDKELSHVDREQLRDANRLQRAMARRAKGG